MKSPDPISEWSQDEIGSWLRGLDAGLDKYKERFSSFSILIFFRKFDENHRKGGAALCYWPPVVSG